MPYNSDPGIGKYEEKQAKKVRSRDLVSNQERMAWEATRPSSAERKASRHNQKPLMAGWLLQRALWFSSLSIRTT